MLRNRNLSSDLFALALLVATVFCAAALITYNPADPVVEPIAPFNQLYQPDPTVYPISAEVTNACGKWGALAADFLLTSLGIGAYYLVLSVAVLDVLLLQRKQIDTPLVRATGWLVSLVGLTVFVNLIAPQLSPGPVIGAGGYLGALGKGLLRMHFATMGSLILSLSMIAGGLLLCTDYALLNIGARGLAMMLGIKRKLKRKATSDDPDQALLDEIEAALQATSGDEEDIDDVVSVKFRGRGKDAGEDPDDDEIQQMLAGLDAALEGVEDGEDQPTSMRKRKNTRADKKHSVKGLRIRKPADEKERQLVMNRLDKASRSDETYDYDLPSLDLLLPGEEFPFEEYEREVRRKAKVLEKTFADFGFNVRVVEVETGPVIAQYEVELEAGLRLSRITGLADDIAIALRVPNVRIVAPIPGKNTVGIEVPNEHRQLVRLREVIEESYAQTKKMRIPLFLGKDVSGNPLVSDLSTLPHLLIAGRTGTGKSVALNAIISSMLMTRRPDEVRMLMIDPKMVELSGYGRLPHLMHPVVTDMRKAEAILAWAVDKMEERYALLANAGVRHISSYNQLGEQELRNRLQPETEEEAEEIPSHLPFIVIVADEMADLMMTAGKEVEQHIIRLAQKSRAVGIHLILATQKPTVDVITGLIKSNLPARISFQVASQTDSRVVLDEKGADKLLGNGDMLFLWPGTSTLLRGQGTYMDDDEIDRLVDSVSTGEQEFVHELMNIKVEDPSDSAPGELKKRDDLYEQAVDVVVREGRGSVSLLQRTLGIGYGRAARLIDFMAEDGIVGPYAGSQAREVLISSSDWERMQGYESEDEPAPVQPKRRKSRTARVESGRDWESELDDGLFEDDDELFTDGGQQDYASPYSR